MHTNKLNVILKVMKLLYQRKKKAGMGWDVLHLVGRLPDILSQAPEKLGMVVHTCDTGVGG